MRVAHLFVEVKDGPFERIEVRNDSDGPNDKVNNHVFVLHLRSPSENSPRTIRVESTELVAALAAASFDATQEAIIKIVDFLASS